MTTDADRNAVYDAIRAIPAGRVAAYGDIARQAGFPRRARWVGRVLRESPASLDLPWYRVLRADGRSAFPEGSAPYTQQWQRLQEEGIVPEGGRVPDRFFIWRERDLDAFLWGPR
jgi:methylated-DNA-protein-cysteine methyltransferase related protein